MTLPEHVAADLGRVVYYAAHTEHLLGRLVPTDDGTPKPMGLSGERLIKKLTPLLKEDAELFEVVDGYERMSEWRNILVHGTHHHSSGVLWTWHIPLKGKGEVARSYQLRDDLLHDYAESWFNLVVAAERIVHRE